MRRCTVPTWSRWPTTRRSCGCCWARPTSSRTATGAACATTWRACWSTTVCAASSLRCSRRCPPRVSPTCRPSCPRRSRRSARRWSGCRPTSAPRPPGCWTMPRRMRCWPSQGAVSSPRRWSTPPGWVQQQAWWPPSTGAMPSWRPAGRCCAGCGGGGGRPRGTCRSRPAARSGGPRWRRRCATSARPRRALSRGRGRRWPGRRRWRRRKPWLRRSTSIDRRAGCSACAGRRAGGSGRRAPGAALAVALLGGVWLPVLLLGDAFLRLDVEPLTPEVRDCRCRRCSWSAASPRLAPRAAVTRGGRRRRAAASPRGPFHTAAQVGEVAATHVLEPLDALLADHADVRRQLTAAAR